MNTVHYNNIRTLNYISRGGDLKLKRFRSLSLIMIALIVLLSITPALAYKKASDFVKEAKKVITGISPEEAYSYLNKKGYAFLDVREPSEYKKEHIPGAKNLPRGLLEFKIGRMFPEREAQIIIVYCKSGARGALSTKVLQEMGYKAINLKGGIAAWKKAGLPTEK